MSYAARLQKMVLALQLFHPVAPLCVKDNSECDEDRNLAVEIIERYPSRRDRRLAWFRLTGQSEKALYRLWAEAIGQGQRD